MNCNQCGREIPENSVFCPFCGVPTKVTADYDYIQGEIGANVDKIKTGERRSAQQKRRAPEQGDRDMYKTRNVYGNDTVFEDDRRRSSQSQRSNSRRRYEEDYYDDYYDDYEDDYEYSRGRGDRYEYDDWGMESGGGNGKTILTTIIIAIICLAGIAAIIYFGFRPQDKANVVDVVRCFDSENVEVSEGQEFQDSVEVVLLSDNNYEIHYTLDGAEVTIDSPKYSEPITSDEEGSLLIKALSFDDKGNPSGEELSRTVVVVKETEEETEEETEKEAKEAAISKEDAEKIVEQALIENNAMNEDFSTEDGGFINLIHAGETTIDDIDYYVVQADYYDADGNIWETTYYGVDTQESQLTNLDKQDGTYTVIE